MRRVLAIAFVVLALGAGLLMLGRPLAQEADSTVLGNLISRALSTPATRVRIGAIDGALSSDATVRDIVISDREGPWLRLDRARLVWRRLALLRGRLEIDRLEVGRLEILRRPLPSEEVVPGADQPILPDLPVKVIVTAFALNELVLGEPILGTAARVGAEGAATLGPPAEGLLLRLGARRLDRPGTFDVGLTLVPQTQALQLNLALDEPEGGIAARAANLPGLPPVRLTLNGTGTLDAFAATLAFTAGDRIGADGQARLNRQADARRLNLALDARIEGLLPAIAAPVFAGITQLRGDIAFADDGAVTVPGLSVASTTARLDVSGTMSAAQVLDLRVAARALPTDGTRTVAGGGSIRRLAFDATIDGPVVGPRVAAKLDLEDAELPSGRVGRAEATFTATPRGPAGNTRAQIALVGDARATGLAPSDPALARALGETLTLRLRGASDADGVIGFETLRLDAGTVRADFTGRAGSRILDGRLALEAPDLTRFGRLAGLDLRGAVSGSARLTGNPAQSLVEAATELAATNFGTGIAPLDGAFGGRATARGTILTRPAGGYGFRDLRIEGAHVSARLDGTATVREAAIDLTATLPDLKRLDSRLTGRADLTGRLGGTSERPDLTAALAVANATMLDRPVPRLAIRIDARDIAGLVDARLDLDGDIAGRPARGGLRLARIQASGWQLSDVDLGVGSVKLRGALGLDAENRAAGRLALTAANLDDLSPLVLTRLAGDIDAQVSLAVRDGAQDAAIRARGRSLRVGDTRIEILDADLAGTALRTRPAIAGSASVERAVIAGETVSRIRFDARRDGAASELTLSADARGFDLSLAGRLLAEATPRLDLSRLEARRAGKRVTLVKPASIAFPDEGIRLSGVALALDGGRLEVDGLVGESLDLTLAAIRVPLGIAELVQPGLGLSGTLDATATVTGTRSAPRGDWRLAIAGLSAPALRGNGVPALTVTGDGRLTDGRSSLDLRIQGGRAVDLRATGSVPVAGGDLDIDVAGQVDLALANATLGISGRRASGLVRIDADIGGKLDEPRIEGSATLSGGTFTDAELGLALDAIDLRLVARGDTIVIERASARTRNGGTLSASGQVVNSPVRGMPGRIRVTGQGAQIVASSLATAVANLSLDINGPLLRRPVISGRIDFTALDVTIPERLPQTTRPLQNVRHVSPPPQVRAKLARDARARARQGRAPAFDAVLDLALSAPNRIFVRGRGVDAELGGQLRLTGTLSSPQPVGAFDLRRGRLQIGGQRLDFTRGRLAFTGTLAPELDFLAETRAGDVTARIGVSGPADEPVFAFTSEPSLPPDEVLSRLLFAKASGGLSAGQALQLAQVAAQFSGGSGGDAFERLRRSLGVDSLDISLGASGSPAVGLSRAISDRVSVGVKAGATPEETGVSIDVDVTRRIRIQGEVTGNGSTGIGIGAEWEY